ncbi:hypothetical protein L1987_21580 [Smallanthus sonchifolius]|uniref:Uncharacterized protein n=1 Tax=Smallanthus sonchifolius TaxID=185202 RepID=A0ACB9IWF5_9ASTR|nr:hypothetical protein L1987_21580 [Smallanthus sonchifolius]
MTAWMKNFIVDLGVMPSIQKLIEILCDNAGAIAQANEPRSHHSMKHILKRFHYIRDIPERGYIMLNKVHTDQNLADPFTKPMHHSKHEEHADKNQIGLRFSRQWIHGNQSDCSNKGMIRSNLKFSGSCTWTKEFCSPLIRSWTFRRPR